MGRTAQGTVAEQGRGRRVVPTLGEPAFVSREAAGYANPSVLVPWWVAVAGASLAQSAERFHGKEEVVGSIPTGGSHKLALAA